MIGVKKIGGISSKKSDGNTKSSDIIIKNNCEESVLTLRCSNAMNNSINMNSNTITVEEEHEDMHPTSKSLSRKSLVRMMKSSLSLNAKNLRNKNRESRLDDIEQDENMNLSETREEATQNGFKLNSDSFSLSIEDFFLDPNSEVQASKPSKYKKVKNIFKAKKGKSNVDMDIGIKLALPEKLDVMRGLKVPRTSTTSTQSDDDKNGTDFFASSEKKLMILPDKPSNVITRSISSIQSPFKKTSKTKRVLSDTTYDRNSQKSEEIVLRSSEFDPSVHQITIPTATEVLIHARVCALMEGYDQLLEARAKAGKAWFSFWSLVGMDRIELKNIYLNAIGQKPEIPMYVGRDSYQPPPLPRGPANLQPNKFGNPFDEKTDLNELGSYKSKSNSSHSPHSSSYKKKKRSQSKLMNPTKPHPSIIKCLLECADDIVVEDYFNETIGEDSDVFDDAGTSNVQVTIFSSQRQRELIVCFRGSMSQHEKPISKSSPIADFDGVNETFSKAYNEAGVQDKIFESLNMLTSENPFCDVCFCGHSFAGNLAIIAAVNCAEAHPMMTVKCHTFGSPKIAMSPFKERAHSLPNLRIFSIEYGSDYYVNQPNDTCWAHVGHSILVSRMGTSAPKSPTSPNKERVFAQAFKFGKNKTLPSKMKRNQMKADHDMRVYLHAIESFTHLGCQWMDKFHGEDGDGILSLRDNEERLVV